MSDKKIILCGPPGAGKTTLKAIFFDHSNPLRLLDTTIEPTRGSDSSVYQLIESRIGIFDLGGQENSRWFGENQDIFHGSSIILAVLSVTSTLNEILAFLIQLLEVKKRQCPEAHLFVLYHKIDLLDDLSIYRRQREIHNFIERKFPNFLSDLRIFRTSIAEKHFFYTFKIFERILESIIDSRVVELDTVTLRRLNLELEILLEFPPGIYYLVDELCHKMRISGDRALDALQDLQYLGFVEVFFGEFFKTHILAENGINTSEAPKPLVISSNDSVKPISLGKPQHHNPSPNLITEIEKLTVFFRISERGKFFVHGLKSQLQYPDREKKNLESFKKISLTFSGIEKDS